MDTGIADIHLAFLPPAPWPATLEALDAAYRTPLTSILDDLASRIRKESSGVSLDIAVAIPWLVRDTSVSRSALFGSTQAVVAGVYKLVCIIAAKNQINVEDAEGIDVRVLLLSYPRDGVLVQENPKQEPGHMVGPVIDLPTLARSLRPWKSVYAVENEEGEKLLRSFLLSQDDRVKLQRVPAGKVTVETEEDVERKTDDIDHCCVIVGGTWDHIHIGHKLLLTMLAFIAAPVERAKGKPREVSIGTTGDELLKNKKFAEQLQSWEERQQSTLGFLRAIMDFRPPTAAMLRLREFNEAGPNGHVVEVDLDETMVLRFVEIWDPFGPTITDEAITALVMSGETRGGGNAVNAKRKEKGWPALSLFEVDVLDAHESSTAGSAEEGFQSKLSSTAIRQAISEKARIKSKA